MSYSDLLNRMKEKDTDAFLELTDRYGWALYSYIRQQHADKAEADHIYNETMNRFYRILQNPVSDDPLESILFAFADLVSNGATSASCVPDSNDIPPQIRLEQIPAQQFPKLKERKGNFWIIMGIILVFAGITVTLWLTAGLLMDMEIIPYVDLGYSWLNGFLADILAEWI